MRGKVSLSRAVRMEAAPAPSTTPVAQARAFLEATPRHAPLALLHGLWRGGPSPQFEITPMSARTAPKQSSTSGSGWSPWARRWAADLRVLRPGPQGRRLHPAPGSVPRERPAPHPPRAQGPVAALGDLQAPGPRRWAC